jgi:hypothetical protein
MNVIENLHVCFGEWKMLRVEGQDEEGLVVLHHCVKLLGVELAAFEEWSWKE